MLVNSFIRVRHTIINIMLIAMIAVLNFIVSDMSALPVFSSEIKYRTGDKNTVALECVVAWDGQYVDDILDTLRAEDARISFVISGQWAVKNADLLKQMAFDGHGIMTCGMSYEDTESLSASKLAESLKQSVQLIESISDTEIKHYFCPNSESAKAQEAAEKSGLQCVRSTVDLLAARGESAEIMYRARNAVKAGSIISFTPTHAMTEALPELISMCRAAGLNVDKV